jgi:DNA-binding CsgD family transcriptional regulator
MFISKEEKERHVIDLYSQGKTYRQIAEEVRISKRYTHYTKEKRRRKE